MAGQRRKVVRDLIHYIRTGELRNEEWVLFRIVAWYCLSRQIRLPQGRCHFFEIIFLLTPLYLVLGGVFRIGIELCKVGRLLFKAVKLATWLFWKPPHLFFRKVNKEDDWAGLLGAMMLYCLAAMGTVLAVWPLTGTPTNEPVIGTYEDFIILLYPWIGGIVIHMLALWHFRRHPLDLRGFLAFGKEASKSLRFRSVGHLTWTAITAVPKGVSLGAQLTVAAGAAGHDLWTHRLCQRNTYGFDTSAYEPKYRTNR